MQKETIKHGINIQERFNEIAHLSVKNNPHFDKNLKKLSRGSKRPNSGFDSSTTSTEVVIDTDKKQKNIDKYKQAHEFQPLFGISDHLPLQKGVMLLLKNIGVLQKDSSRKT